MSPFPAKDLVATLHSKGVALFIRQGKLRTRGSRSAVTAELRTQIRANKTAILDFLGQAKAGAPAPIAAVHRDGPAPLSHAQQRLWRLDRLDGPNPVHNRSLALRLRGPLDLAALERALRTVADRHQSLRAVFHQVGGQPVQTIDSRARVDLLAADLGGLAGAETAALTLIERAMLVPFRLTEAPLLRAIAVRTGRAEHFLLINTHRIVADDWSSGVIIREVAELYAAAIEQRPAQLPTLPIQYADYAIWQRSLARTGALDRHLAFWRERLADAPRLVLPTDRDGGDRPACRGVAASFSLTGSELHAVREACRKRNCTAFTFVYAAFSVLLARYVDQRDIVIGTDAANRNRPEIEPLIGSFVNQLALRLDLRGNPTAAEIMARARDAASQAYANQEAPFDLVARELGRDGDSGDAPFFQVKLVHQSRSAEGQAELPGLKAAPAAVSRPSAQLDLTLMIWDSEASLGGSLVFNADRFEQSTATLMAARLQRLCHALAGPPNRRLAALPIMDDAERRRIVVEWNDTRAAYRTDRPFHRRFEILAARWPDAPAIRRQGQTLSYGALDRQANRLAGVLRRCGVGPESMAGVCLSREPDLILAILATLKAGGAFLPLDPNLPKAHLAYMIRDAKPAALIAKSPLLPRLPASEPNLAHTVLLDEDWQAETDGHPHPACRIWPDQAAYALYTSGSTGAPKGVVATHRGLTNYLSWAAGVYQAVGPDAPALAAAHFDAAVTSLLLPLTIGGAVALIPEGDELKAPAEALPQPGFGFTEAAAGCCVKTTTARPQTETTPISRPIANTRLYLLDRDSVPVPPGGVGQLHIGGDGLARGYLGRPDLTAERFRPDPISGHPGERLYASGDLARMTPTGELVFLGSCDAPPSPTNRANARAEPAVWPAATPAAPFAS